MAMEKLTKYVTWWLLVLMVLLVTAHDSWAIANGESEIAESSTYAEVNAQIDTWVQRSMNYSLNLLGIEEMECSGTYIHNEDGRQWRFETEPEITRIDRDAPTTGWLKQGDVIVAVDGLLITTKKAGIRFANLVAGEPVQLTVRRAQRERTLTMVARKLPEPDIPIEFRAHYNERDNTLTVIRGKVLIPELARTIETIENRENERARKTDSLGILASPQYADRAPRGWIGFGLSFAGSMRRNDDGKPADWIFFEQPSIKSIQPDSPADQAGLRVNDVLLAIDGLALDSESGGRRFSRMEPGETIAWKVKRGRETMTIETVAAERPSRLAPPEPESGVLAPDTLPPIRYIGGLGATKIEVRGSRTVQIDTVDETGEIVIRASDAVVRLTPRNPR
jgi:membrane-associated protease RseP (regulator of RpoE activity)